MVTFETPTDTADGRGGFTRTWATSHTARAHVRGTGGREVVINDRITAINGKRVTVRYFAGLEEKDRVTIAGRVHNIRYINNVEERNEWLVINVDGGVAT